MIFIEKFGLGLVILLGIGLYIFGMGRSMGLLFKESHFSKTILGRLLDGFACLILTGTIIAVIYILGDIVINAPHYK